MRKNIFELMQGNEIDLHEEYYRLNRIFRYTHFEDERSIMNFIEFNNYFANWPHRKRYISIDDLLKSLKIDGDHMKSENITVEKLLLYSETIYNIVNLVEYDKLNSDNKSVFDVLRNNILDLLEDMNYSIEENSEKQFIIIEKDPLSTAIAEKIPEITDIVIEYRRFSLKGDIKSKKEILLKLVDKIEPLREKFKGTNYKNILEDINMLLNNLNIRHNNLEGPKKKDYTVNMTEEVLENWYDKTYDMILGAFILEDYIDNKDALAELKSHF